MHRQVDISAQIVQVILNHQVLKIVTKKHYWEIDTPLTIQS